MKSPRLSTEPSKDFSLESSSAIALTFDRRWKFTCRRLIQHRGTRAKTSAVKSHVRDDVVHNYHRVLRAGHRSPHALRILHDLPPLARDGRRQKACHRKHTVSVQREAWNLRISASVWTVKVFPKWEICSGHLTSK